MKMKTLTVNDRAFQVNDGGAVRYDEKQTLDEAQKALARENIGAEEGLLEILLTCQLLAAVADGDGGALAEADGTILLNL